jgi:hypothetical protein
MLGGTQRRAILNTELIMGTAKVSWGTKVGPDWDRAQAMYGGTPNRSSYDYTKPGAYVRKDERPSTTGKYGKMQPTRSGHAIQMLTELLTSKLRRGSAMG